jgi:hypothetical protein
MWRSRVPELAVWKADCAWLRSIVHRAMVIGATPSGESFDPDAISTDSISMEHLRALHTLFVAPSTAATEEAAKAKAIVAAKHNGADHTHTVAQRSDGHTIRAQLSVVAAATAPRDGAAAESNSVHGEPTARQLALVTAGALRVPHATRSAVLRTTSLVAVSTEPVSAAVTRRGSTQLLRRGSVMRPPPDNWFLALVHRFREEAGLEVARFATQRVKTIRRALSTMLYSNERSLLLKALLEWAKHDKMSLVSEPRHNQMRWRTQYEWQALRLANVELGEHETAERSGTRVARGAR